MAYASRLKNLGENPQTNKLKRLKIFEIHIDLSFNKTDRISIRINKKCCNEYSQF